MAWLRWVCLILAVAGLLGCSSLAPMSARPQSDTQKVAELPLVNCVPPMDDPDYWIIKYPRPDKIFLSPRQIQRLNQTSVEHGLVNDVFSEKLWNDQPKYAERQEEENNAVNPGLSSNQSMPGTMTAARLQAYLREETDRIKMVPRWDAQGKPVGEAYYRRLDENLNLAGITSQNPIRYGLMRRRSDFRYYPTHDILKLKPSPWEFDVLQVSAVQAYQPVAILHASRDGRWMFGVAPACRGWVPSRDVALAGRPEELRPFTQPRERLVVVGHYATVAAQPGDTLSAERFYMGTVCPLIARDARYYQIALPEVEGNSRLAQRVGYILREDAVHEGFLPCTPRTICDQAFKLLHTPYSWGGAGEYRDCSQLVMDVFATVGLALPRNSGGQGQVGNGIVRLNHKHKAARRLAELGRLDHPALLQFPGHVMLFIGREGNRAYAIHDIWSFRQPESSSHDRKIIIGQVVVSDLSLGEDSTRGSLLERITVINRLQP
ncbi:MAG: hypothetical protein HGA76_00190 [Candidatus Firestonebacteria bacterium]|nr:hypothetical protein [Candidatus Firestonebacteria bacterium]